MPAIRRWLALALIAVSLFLPNLSTSAALADDPGAVTTRLEPGLNYVGWLGPSVTLAEFFAALPQADAVFVWSVSKQAWLMASPRVPESLHTLPNVRTGVGLVIRLGGDRAVEWTRPLVLGSGLLHLSPGFNLLAWSADEPASVTEIEQNLRTKFQRTDGDVSVAEGLQVPDQPQRPDSSGLVQQGGAVWIHSDLYGVWHQRSLSNVPLRGRLTGPEGEPLEGVRVRADITDGSNWLWWDVTDAQGSFSMLVPEHGPYELRIEEPFECQLYYHAGEPPARSRELATTVYASSDLAELQIQIPKDACGWHIRGRVVDAEGTPLPAHAVWATETTTRINSWNRTGEQGAFDIRVAESGHYRLFVYLEEQCSAHYVGPGVTSAEHLAATPIEVDQAHINDFLFIVPDEPCGGTIRGTLTRSDGSPVSEGWVTAWRVDRQSGRSAASDAGGAYTIRAIDLFPDTPYILTIAPQDTCFIYYREGGVSRTRDGATQVSVTDTRETRINVVLPEGACEWRIHGRALTSDGEPVAGIGIRVWGSDGERNSTTSTPTDSHGGFSLTVPASGSYRLVLKLDDRCAVLNEQGQWSSAQPIDTTLDVAGGDVFGVVVETPQLRCGWRVSGRVVDQHGAGIGGAPLALAPGDGGNVGLWPSTSTEPDGRFVIQTVTIADTYLLRLDLGNDCFGYHSGDMLTPSWAAALPLHVSEESVSDVLVRVPQDFCRH